MYISAIRMQNYRRFKDLTVEFNKGLNVVIGENNAGKTALFRALGLVFDYAASSRRLTADDFYRDFHRPDGAPQITVTATLRSSEGDSPEDRSVVLSWLTKLDDPWEATLAFTYALPEADLASFQRDITTIEGEGEDAVQRFWETVGRYAPRYVSRIYGGNPSSELRAEPEWLNRFSYQLLDALRDAEADMLSGRSAVLRTVLSRFLDQKPEGDQSGGSRADFLGLSREIVRNLLGRVDLASVLKLASDTGASIGGTPALEGHLTEGDLLGALRLVIDNNGVRIPITHNGMGYNNLVYMSLVLAAVRSAGRAFLGENTKTYPILLIEEPEAHLHPSMQYRFIRFLRSELNNPKAARQVFITTHSTHVTAAVGLDSIVCMTSDEQGAPCVSYPGRVFGTSPEDRKSKARCHEIEHAVLQGGCPC